MFKKLLELLKSGIESYEELKDYHDTIRQTPESKISAEVGEESKNSIMEWWYDVCDTMRNKGAG